MEFIDKNELFKILEQKYGDLENDRGCYTNNRWLSIVRIIECINECCVYN